MKTHSESFPDHNQNFWELACIQSISLGLPGFLIGGHLANIYGKGIAITSVIIGNLIQWIIGLTIISMAATDRDNAIQNTKKYLGTFGGILAALFLVLAFLSWYIIQIDSAVVVIKQVLSFSGSQLRWGAGLGLFIALLSIGGIRLIKLFSVSVFPIMFGSVLFAIIHSFSNFEFDGIWGFSVLGIVAIMGNTLAGIVNLPTFFRHSRSNADSYLGLSLIIIFTGFFQTYAIIADYSDLSSIQTSSFFNTFFLVGFILISLVAVNLVNIYFASAGWEMILPHRRSPKEYAIVGLLGTMAYTFLQISAPMEFLGDMTNNFIACLGIILLMAFLVKMVVQHRPRPLERFINVGCWIFGGTFGTVVQLGSDKNSANSLIASVSASLIAFLVVIFIEEGIWSARKILSRKIDEIS